MPEKRLRDVQDRIRDACHAAGRSPEAVRLLAVSKTQPAAEIRALVHAGQRRFGESYADEAAAKQDQLAEEAIEWHFIGPIQSNKTRLISERFDWVHGVDRVKIARRLADQRPADRGRLNVFIQVNLDAEEGKAGCRPEDIPALAADIAGRERLHLRGLMAIPAPRDDPAGQREAFQRLAKLAAALRREHPQADELSAGMSADLEAAVAAGSTLVRVGTALFGPRRDR